MLNNLVEYSAAALSVLGAPLAASSLESRRRLGYVIWTAANIIWMNWGLYGEHYGLVCQYVFFLATSIAGIRNNKERKPT